MTKTKIKPELLAPAGSLESVIAAVRCGADAVYLGAKDFSARRSAHNFDEAELRQAVEYCHLHGAAVHMAVNILVMNDEIERLVSCVKTAAGCGVDAFIVQDIGAAGIIKQVCPKIPLHASTQLSVHTADGALAMKRLGFKRVVLARELSLSEIGEIAAETELELEVFIHGALCMSVSGQCYYSAMLGSRSGNRGLCAQPCRLQFSASSRESDYALSLKDLCAASSVEKLMELGVTSFKIEGRMKRPEYVAAAVGVYRDLIDGKSADLSNLRAVFSRSGFTNGYLEAERGSEMFGFRKKEDVTAAAGVLKTLKNSYNRERQNIGLDMEFTLKAGKPVCLRATDFTHTVSSSGDLPQEAVNIQIPGEKIGSCLRKLGNTPYFAENIKLDVQDGFTVAVSEINRLRRDCCEQLTALRTEVKPAEIFDYDKIDSFPKAGEKKLWGRFSLFSDISDYAADNLSKIVLPVDEIIGLSGKIKFKEKLAAELPRALFGKEKELSRKLLKLKNLGVQEAVASNIASVVTAKKLGFIVHGGFSLNLTNDYSFSEIEALGASSAVVSPELELARINRLAARLPLGLFAYGRLPLMLTRNCPVKGKIGCEKCGKNSVLYDRKNIEFPIACSGGFTELLNSTPVYMADRLREVAVCDYLVLYFTTEKNIDEIIKAYISREGPTEKDFTRGLYYRGVL